MAISNTDRQARFRVRQNGLKLRVSVQEADILLRLLDDHPNKYLRDKIDRQATEQLRESFIEYMDGLREQDELTYDIEEA
jgi:hypothetical protein